MVRVRPKVRRYVPSHMGTSEVDTRKKHGNSVESFMHAMLEARHGISLGTLSRRMHQINWKEGNATYHQARRLQPHVFALGALLCSLHDDLARLRCGNHSGSSD